MIEAEVPKQWVGKSLAQLGLSRNMGLTVLALKPQEGTGSVPRGETVLREGDVIVVGGSRENLDASELLSPGGR